MFTSAIPLIVPSSAVGDRLCLMDDAEQNDADGLEPSPTDAPVVRRIKQAMRAKKIRQADLARGLGTDKTTVWKYLTGRLGTDKKLVEIARVLKVEALWLKDGDGEPGLDEHTRVIEAFIKDMGPCLVPALTPAEANYLRVHPNHRVTAGGLLDAVMGVRSGLSPEDTARSVEKTGAARAKGAALGVPKRKPR